MRARLTLALAGMLALSVALAASTPTFWTVSTQADFLKGDVENLSIDSDGRVLLGPSTTQLADTPGPFVWTLLAGGDGTVWAGTGNQGRVLRIGRDGRTATVFESHELEVHALAAAPGGGVYAATSPDGKIYKIAADGTAATFFDPDDKYIWALASTADGTLFAATGEKGIIYKITPAGSGTVFYKAASTNVVSLALDASGTLFAGTDSPGRLLRIGRDGKAFVLLDSPFKEIAAIRLTGNGTIYAAAFSGSSSGADDHGVSMTPPSVPDTQPHVPIPVVTAEITGITMVDAGSGAGAISAASSAPKRPAKGAIYRVRPDGLWDLVWEALDDQPFDVLPDADGSLLVATGKDGKLFRLNGDPARATLVARAPAKQITALARDSSGRVIAATSNPGKVVAIATSHAATGTYTSDVRDAGTVATWGAIRWHASGSAAAVAISTRTGNTATPDDTWSAWSSAYSDPSGDHIASPNARYLQWRAVLTGTSAEAGPILTSVTAAYLPRNVRPVVSSITVHPAGVVFQKPFSTGEAEFAGYDEGAADVRNAVQAAQQAAAASASALTSPNLGRKTYQKGLQTFAWKADDDNDDRLQYDVFYRREGDTTWTPLKRGLWDPIFVWDTTTVPDGTYYVRITASDAASNSPETALTGELDSTSFDVDNTAPVIDVQSASVSGSRAVVKFEVRDQQSAVARVEYSLDGFRWQVAYPVDGIADSRREQFDLGIEGAHDARRVIIRATDAMNNVVTAAADFRK